MVNVGNLLLAEPFMLDPNFLRTVVLVCEHDNEIGTLGYVLNQPCNLFLSDVMEDLPGADFPLFIGGPVGHDAVHYIHRLGDQIPESKDLGNEVYWGGNFETIHAMLAQNQLSHNDIKFFLGYSGWEVGQMAEEMKTRSWMICSSFNPALPFLYKEEDLWKEAIIAMGPKYAHVANFPIDPRLN